MTWLSDAAIDRLRDVADWPVPQTDRYEVLEPIARGGMGTVYCAQDRELDRRVAVKVLSAATVSSEAAARMRQEAHILARLEHPGIVPVYDVGILDDGRVFYVMKLVQGLRLDEHVTRRPITERLRLFARICEPVAFAHAHGVVHRDLKPENVMVGPFGEVLVMDWGAALVESTAMADRSGLMADEERRVDVIGTRGYMAPEQARGQPVGPRADVYALGGLLHFLLTGNPPDRSTLTGPRPLQAICRKARADAAADRYIDVVALAADVDRFLAGEPVSVLSESAVDRTIRFARKHRAAIAIVGTYLTIRYLIAWLAP
jgi:eukaryotic-like serine/threonine-protein kinase